MKEHGHYRNSPYMIQQRKMSFNSSNSSGECTLSYIKVPGGGDSPLDLRLSPALRRIQEDSKENKEGYRPQPGDLINFDSAILEAQNQSIAIEHFQLVIRRSEIKSDSSAMTSYKSVFSDTGRSGSLPDIQFTPKIAGGSLIKKTISFETPDNNKTQEFNDDDDDDDDVFFTPKASPVKLPISRTSSTDTVIPIEDDTSYSSSKSRNIWNLVSVLGETLKFSKFKRPSFVKRAADYFSKRASEPDEFPLKRRRPSSTSSSVDPLSPPATKRQKIQGRKPIRHASLN